MFRALGAGLSGNSLQENCLGCREGDGVARRLQLNRRMRMRSVPAWVSLLILSWFWTVTATAVAWDAHGHRTITYLAIDGLPPDMPSWLREARYAARIADQSNEPDRWRGTRRPAIRHEANPEHYINAEDLEYFGLTLESLPRLRYEYFRAMAIARHEHPGRFPPYDPSSDEDKTREWPGFLPHAIAEHHAKLQASFNSMRILEILNDPARSHELEQARSNVIYHMGVLSHFVGDAAQPLHTTRHHHGWVGENPRGYTTDYGIHAYIDGRILRIHSLDYASLRPRMNYIAVDAQDPWPEILAFIRRSLDEVEPLYAMRKDGSLEQAPGRAFIADRLCDGAAMLSALYRAAWESSEPTEQDVAAFVRFAGRRTEAPDLTRPEPATVP